MTSTNITMARSNLFKLANNCIQNNDIININTKNGNVVMMSEEEYGAMVETLYLNSIPNLAKKIVDAMVEPVSESVELDWKNEL